MATYSPSLKLTLLADGEQPGLWGGTTNTNLGTLLEQAITGVLGITMVDANYTLTDYNGLSDEARNAVIVVAGTNNAIRKVICPLVNKLYTIVNNTVGGYAITVGGSTGSYVTVPNGATMLIYCDGTNFKSGLTGVPNSFTVAGSMYATGNVNATTAFVGPGTGLTGTAANFTSNTAINIVGGTAGRIPYQTAANTTAFTDVGTAGYVLQANGTSAPTWATGVPAGSVVTTNFWIGESGGQLVFKYGGSGGTVIASMDSSGNIVTGGSMTTGGTP